MLLPPLTFSQIFQTVSGNGRRLVVQGKSGLARAGLAVHITAPHIHPGYSGPIALELYNRGPWPLEFVPGEARICQLIFYRVTSPVNAAAIQALKHLQSPNKPVSEEEGSRGRAEALQVEIRGLLGRLVPRWFQRTRARAFAPKHNAPLRYRTDAGLRRDALP